MATINLGSIKFNWKGDYAAGTAYAVDDVVNSSGTSYVCVAASTGNAPPNSTYWNVMAQGGSDGSDGTDLTTTLTTQGDILYRDGSGLQRLPKGTAGQVLQMNSGATAPEYGTVSSDYVLLHTNEWTSNTSSVVFDNHFSSTYKNYKFIMSVRPDSTSSSFNYPVIRMRRSGSSESGNTYHTLVNHVDAYDNPSDNNQLTRAYADYQHNTSYGKLSAQNWSGGLYAGSTQYFLHTEITLFDPLGTSHYKGYTSNYIQRFNAGYMSTGIATAYQHSTSAIDGVQFLLRNSGNMNKGSIKLYGIK